MLVFENALLALGGLKANKTRSILTMLGIIIGIASVITIMTIGTSISSSFTKEMASMGASNITLGIQQKIDEEETDDYGMTFRYGPGRKEMQDSDYLSAAMVDDIMEHFEGRLEKVLKDNEAGNGKISIDGESASVILMGANDAYLESEKLELLAGRLFTDRDQEQAKKVVVVSDRVVDDCLKTGYEEALGDQITVTIDDKYYHFTIVGVYRYDESAAMYSFSSETQTNMYTPIATSFNTQHTRERYSNLEFMASDVSDINGVMDDLEEYVNVRFYRKNKNFEASCFSMSSMLESYTSMLGTISTAVSVIAGISLLVGGIGVMNIMLVSIQERTREIGTRKALGATNSSIRLQFIVEAIVLCIVGGVIGIIIGLVAGYIATPLVDEEAVFYPPIAGIFYSVGFSVAVGVFFGYYPANKAAKMNPIDALRYE